ncbi:hypothetical protein ElyMa_005493500 [Elysia marginata]|uniref:Uncharacterized protein n=1 Tax=Elysia marginata TaxID=1093978 RepID=A0AAV4ETR4_9GAST|nr:hypothetical protein ElyMa_005493500 [Elysia marginata]
MKEKSKVMVSSERVNDASLTKDDEPLELVHKFKYLGACLHEDGSSTVEVRTRIALATAAFAKLGKIWKSSISFKAKHKLFRSLGTVEGKRRRGRQRKAWCDNIKEWTGMAMYELVRFFKYTPEQNGIFDQCLPDDASPERLGEVDFYFMTPPKFEWLVGMKPVPDTSFFYRVFSRFSHEQVTDSATTFGVLYKFSPGLSDPTVFDKDFSECVETSFTS